VRRLLDPLYAYVRRRGYSAEQAQDLTQEFFVRVLDGRYLDRADQEKGRFRAFILTSLKFFLADEADRNRAQKRGGGNLLSLETSSGEDRYQRDPAHDETPERIFERRWALSVLDRVLEKLRNEFVHHGRPEHFERLKVFLLGQSDAPYAALAREMKAPSRTGRFSADATPAAHGCQGECPTLRNRLPYIATRST
jgi:RNA polymerase sigma factor (sigma-70 family)